MKIKQLLPSQTVWTSPTALGIDKDGNVWINTQAECTSAGIPRLVTQSAKVTMVEDEEVKVQIPITWTNALPELNFRNKIKVKEIKGR